MFKLTICCTINFIITGLRTFVVACWCLDFVLRPLKIGVNYGFQIWNIDIAISTQELLLNNINDSHQMLIKVMLTSLIHEDLSSLYLPEDQSVNQTFY
jgi:hypothetical protein